MSTGTCSDCGRTIFRPGPGRPAKVCDACRVGNDYGGAHKRLRAEWQARLDVGEPVICHAVTCLEPSRQILPGTPWDLGHTPDGQAWTGPEHATCNRADGGRRSHGGGAAHAVIVRDPGPPRPGVEHRPGCGCETQAARMGVWPSRCW